MDVFIKKQSWKISPNAQKRPKKKHLNKKKTGTPPAKFTSSFYLGIFRPPKNLDSFSQRSAGNW